VKSVTLLIILLICISAFGKNVEDFEYYTVYSDFKVPSINVGMFVPAVGHKTTSPSNFKEARIKAIRKWSAKSYYAICGTEVIKLKIKSFTDKLIKDGGGGRNYNLRILFEPINKKILVVLTSRIRILKNEQIDKKERLSKKQARNLLKGCVSNDYSHVSQLSGPGGFGTDKIGRVQLIKKKYVIQYVEDDKRRYSNSTPIHLDPIGTAYIKTKFKLIHFSKELNSKYGDQLLIYDNQLVFLFSLLHRDLRLDSKVTTPKAELYFFSYGTEFGPFGRTVYILKKEGEVFTELRNRNVKNVAQFYSDEIWGGWD
jgi:hypothetical protein